MQSKYMYKLEYYINPERIEQFEKSFGKIIETHKGHKNGLGKEMNFYKTFIGEEDRVILLVPMKTLGEMDLWIHTPDLVIEFLGKEEGTKVLIDYEATLLATKSSIIEEYTIQV